MNNESKNNGQKTRVLGYTVAVELTNQELHQVAGGVCAAGQDNTWSHGTNQTYEDDCK